MNLSNTKDRKASKLPHEYPLTKGQAALWFHYKLAPKSVAYNLAGAVAISGDVDLTALRRAFQKMAERHPLLRTLFSSNDSEPVQRVCSSIKADYQVKDASEWDLARFDTRLAEEIYHPIDLEKGPTWRVVVFQKAPLSGEKHLDSRSGENLVLLVLHHILGDMWSVAIILSEVAALYRQEATGAPAKLRPLRNSYGGYVYQELEQLAGPQAQTSLNYWRNLLSGELSPLSLPVDRPRQPISSGRGAAHSILLDPKLTSRLRSLAEAHHANLYTVLLSAFQALLHRYTGQNDVLVGFPKAGRSPSTMRVVGYFINQMVVRTDFSEHPGFIDLLNSVQKSLKDGAEHDWYPFPLLVQYLQPDRDLSRSPLIQAVFSWQRAPHLIPGENAGPFVLGQKGQGIDLNGMHVRSVELPYRVAPFDLIMLAAEASNGIALTIEYAVDLFDASTIARMAECFRTLLESIVSAPERPVSDLAIMPESERRQVIETWNATAAPSPTQACLHQLFEKQVDNTSEIVAVTSGEERMTYRQLNRRANQLAHFLRMQGVGPEDLVGVFLEPSVQMVAAVLGILKAGAAYLPLDPANPRERLAFMLSDARPCLLITRQGLRLCLPDSAGPLFLIDANENQLRDQPRSNPSGASAPEHLAYIIYTSGSTGQPKGVMLTHRGVVNLLADFQRRRAIQPGDACSWWTSPGFDVSVYEIFSPLLAGGSLHVIPQKIRLDASRLLDWLSVQRIRSAYLPPFFLEDFAKWVNNHPGVSSLRRLLVGVEPIPDALLVQILADLPSLSIINGYGPTETTICSTLYQVDRGQARPGNTPIGRPVANTQIYLLDRALQPVPVGVVGELYIGGEGLARGYLNQSKLTEQRFIPSPFQPGERLYRTGDLARYLPDGNLVFMGRSDTQVKIHGVRIELTEIEATLRQHPRVNGSVVLLHEAPSGGKRLVAFITVMQDAPASIEEIHHYLEERLPFSMLPSEIVVLDAFPLNPNGKVDRKALQSPQNSQSGQTNACRLPGSEIEQTLTSIWQQVLGVEAIGVDDNFFELGGDSILSLQIVARAAEAGIHLRPRHIFQAPTIAGLASLANTAVPVRAHRESECDSGEIPLTPIQRWFFEQNFTDPHHWNQSLIFVTSRPLNPLHLRFAVAALLEHHDALRLRYIHGPSGWQQTCIEPTEELPFEVIDLSGLSQPQQVGAIERYVAKFQCSLNLSTGPLIRVVYFDLGANRAGRLLIVIHHLVVDGLSWRILLEDLQSAYRQHALGQPLHLPARTTPFQAWARRLAGFAGSEELLQEADYWLRIGQPRSVMLPENPLIPGQPIDTLNKEGCVGHFSISLRPEDTRALLREMPSTFGTKIDVILLTALTRAFQNWTGGESLWVDLEAHGREDLFTEFDLSRTIGWFTSLYPVCLTLPRDAGRGEAIKRIKEQLSHIPHHGLGFGLLRYLCPDPTLNEGLKAIPAPSISFNYLGQLPQASVGGILSDLAPESIAPQRCPEAPRAHLIEINAVILHDTLQFDWSYSSRFHSARTIEHVTGLLINELRQLIAYCRSLKMVEYTPSDFPGANLSQAELDAILPVMSRPGLPALQRNLESIYPLSPMQQGMLFHTLFSPESGVYFEQITFTLQGPFDVSAFEKAWQQLIERQAILRTSFVWQGLDRMLQIVHKEVKIPFLLQDWRNMPVSEQKASFERLLNTERRRGFDLSVPPLWRLAILRTAEDTYHIVFNHHHALLDGWSVALLFQEVFAIYEASIRGDHLILPLARPYQDYIAWLQSHDLTKSEAFWREELKGYVPFEWNTDQPSPPTGATQPAEMEQRLSTRTTIALHALARKGHVTFSTLVQGAWAILLGRYFERNDVIFGITFSGRSSELPGSLSMVGLFINTLPLRVRMTAQKRVVEWLQEIQWKFIAVQQYDYTPLAQIQTWSGVPRNSPLFDTLLVFENYPAHNPFGKQEYSLQMTDVRSIEQTTYPLTVAVTPGEKLDVRILYDPERYDPEAIQHLLNDLREVLERIVANPDQTLSTLCWEPQCRTEKAEFVSSQAGFTPGRKRDLNVASDREIFPRTEGNAPPNGPLVKHLERQWEKLLKLDQVGINDNFFQLGGDSLIAAICNYQLQDEMHETIPLTAIFETPTVSGLARYLEQAHPDGVARLLGAPIPKLRSMEAIAHPNTLVPIQPRGSKPPLFCIHPAGGIVFPYYTLAACLGAEQPLYGIQDPSLYNSQIVPQSIEAMASSYLEAIKEVQPEGPYHLLGWSAGGDVAYEMAQQLYREGQQVAALIMLDTPAPTRMAHVQPLPKDRLNEFTSWVKRLPGRLRGVRSAIRPIASYIHSGLFLLAASGKQSNVPSGSKLTFRDLLGWAGFDTWRTSLLKHAEVASMVSQETSLLLIEMPEVRRILRLVQEHRRLARRYRADAYPGRIVLFHAMHSGPNKLGMTDPTMGWGRLAEYGVEVRTIQANHVALLVKPHVEILAKEIRDCLDRIA